VTVCCLLLYCGSALAQKVLNPTNGLTVTADAVSFGVHQGSAAFDASPPVSGSAFISSATVAADGSVTVPTASMTVPPIPVPDQSGSCGTGCTYTVTGIVLHIVPVTDTTGHINPFTGAADLAGQFYVHADLTACVSFFGGPPGCQTPTACQFGSAASPISLALTTGTTTAPAASFYGSINGTPYSESTGTLQLVDDTLVLPASQNCLQPPFDSLEGIVDSSLGLPTSPGNAKLAVTATLNPILRRGVIAALVPDVHAGAAPLTVHFDASTSQAPAAATSYAFDFNGDGTVDQTGAAPTGSFTYPAPGSYTARVTVTDRDGDSDTATIPITVSAPPGPPAVTGSGTFSVDVHGKAAVVTDGQSVTCPAGGPECGANVVATTRVPSSARSHTSRAPLRVGGAKISVAAGGSKPVRFPLTKAGKALLRRRGKLRVTVTVVVRAGTSSPLTFHKTGTLRWPHH
jgi:hypothetical protein